MDVILDMKSAIDIYKQRFNTLYNKYNKQIEQNEKWIGKDKYPEEYYIKEAYSKKFLIFTYKKYKYILKSQYISRYHLNLSFSGNFYKAHHIINRLTLETSISDYKQEALILLNQLRDILLELKLEKNEIIEMTNAILEPNFGYKIKELEK